MQERVIIARMFPLLHPHFYITYPSTQAGAKKQKCHNKVQFIMNSFSKIKINYAFSVKTMVLTKNKLEVFEKKELQFIDEFVYQVF